MLFIYVFIENYINALNYLNDHLSDYEHVFLKKFFFNESYCVSYFITKPNHEYFLEYKDKLADVNYMTHSFLGSLYESTLNDLLLEHYSVNELIDKIDTIDLHIYKCFDQSDPKKIKTTNLNESFLYCVEKNTDKCIYPYFGELHYKHSYYVEVKNAIDIKDIMKLWSSILYSTIQCKINN